MVRRKASVTLEQEPYALVLDLHVASCVHLGGGFTLCFSNFIMR